MRVLATLAVPARQGSLLGIVISKEKCFFQQSTYDVQRLQGHQFLNYGYKCQPVHCVVSGIACNQTYVTYQNVERARVTYMSCNVGNKVFFHVKGKTSQMITMSFLVILLGVEVLLVENCFGISLEQPDVIPSDSSSFPI